MKNAKSVIQRNGKDDTNVKSVVDWIVIAVDRNGHKITIGPKKANSESITKVSRALAITEPV